MSVLYTTMPLELMFPSEESTNRQYVKRQGRLMEVELVDYNQAKLVRLFSTDPNDYLNEQLQPGVLV